MQTNVARHNYVHTSDKDEEGFIKIHRKEITEWEPPIVHSLIVTYFKKVNSLTAEIIITN